MPTFRVNMSFEHTYTMIINAQNKTQAESIAENTSMDSDDKRIIEEYDGNFAQFIRIEDITEVIDISK